MEIDVQLVIDTKLCNQMKINWHRMTKRFDLLVSFSSFTESGTNRYYLHSRRIKICSLQWFFKLFKWKDIIELTLSTYSTEKLQSLKNFSYSNLFTLEVYSHLISQNYFRTIRSVTEVCVGLPAFVIKAPKSVLVLFVFIAIKGIHRGNLLK